MCAGSCWKIGTSVNGFAGFNSDELVTQVAKGRVFQLIDDFPSNSGPPNDVPRFQVRLLEDGYLCWINISEVIGQAFQCESWEPQLLSRDQINLRVPNILNWLKKAGSCKNKYLWGGTIGPDFDCSGLVQAAFASEQIWLPRDAYQQEQFCEKVEISCSNYQNLNSGDLLFFGTSQRCNHVAIYMGSGIFCHSSGIENGRNGIGCDRLQLSQNNSIASYYLLQLRGAGRVVRCHNGITLP